MDDSPSSSMTKAKPSSDGEESHRSKRVKTGDPKATLLLKPAHNDRVTPPARGNEKILLELVAGKEQYQSPYQMAASSQPKLPSQAIDAAVQANDKVTDIEVDFSAAPSDPVELAIWVAQQISRYDVNGPESDGNQDEENGSISSSRPDQSVQSENANTPDGNRIILRKPKRDKDNDLRCRVNARAKTLWGEKKSLEKTAWTESEFKKRKTKREKKRQNNGTFPGFTLDVDLATTLFPDQSTYSSKQIHAAGTLLLNTLQGVRNGSISPNRDSAAALIFALKNSSDDLNPFVEALRILGKTPQVIDTINSTMEVYDELMKSTDRVLQNPGLDKVSAHVSGGSTTGASESPHSSVKTSGLRGGAASLHDIDTDFQSDDKVKALNTATGILTDIAAGTSDTYVTPYANPPIVPAPNGLGMTKGSSNQGVNNEPTRNGAEPSVDRSRIDDLLKLAAGDSESDEDEDDLLSDPRGNIQNEETSNARPDDDVLATLQRIVNELMMGRNGSKNPPNASNGSGSSNITPSTDIFRSEASKEQALALKRSFDRAGVSINTIIPAAQSQATSQLYAHLSSRANRFPTPGGGINPNNASAYGNTADMTQRMLSRPGNAMQTVQTTSPTPGTSFRPPIRARTAEELRKVQEFGFPPLPGSRPGQKRKL